MGFVNLQGTKSKTGKKTDQAGEKENDEDDGNDEEEGDNAENQFYHNSPPSHVKVGRQLFTASDLLSDSWLKMK